VNLFVDTSVWSLALRRDAAIREYLAVRDDLLKGATVREVEVAP